MNRRVVLAFVVLLGMTATAYAVPTFTVGNHTVNQGASLTFQIMVSGGDAISGVDLNLEMGDGGPDSGNAGTGPVITAVDLVTGTIFAANSTFAPPGQTFYAGTRIWQMGDSTTSGSVTATGVLATVTINATGIPIGSYRLSIGLGSPADIPPSDYSTTTASGLTPLNGDLGQAWGPDGLINVVPEPSSIVLSMFAAAGLGALAIRRRRARA